MAGRADVRRKPALVLAYLAVEGPQERRHVAEVFWRDAKDPQASLRVALSQLRSADERLVRSEDGRLSTELRTDAHGLMEALERGESASLGLYQGPFLHGVGGRGVGPELEEWIVTTREYVTARLRHSLLVVAERRARDGDLHAAGELVDRLVGMAPLEELDPERLPRVHTLLERTGSSLAPRVASLARDYGMTLASVDPGAGAAGFASGRAIEWEGTFVGRGSEVTQVEDRLADPGCRLVTILGGAGSGKTRLAHEVAFRLGNADRYPDGVHLVDLADVADPSAVPDRIARSLGMVLQARSDEAEQLAAMLAERRALLVLDNFEHLMAAREVVVTILRRCPAVDLLVTSRESLRLAHEWGVVIGGLRYPEVEPGDARNALGYDAVRLFLQRARRGGRAQVPDAAGMSAVARICRAVAGIPLGVELAAAWTRTLALPDLADELDGSFELLEMGAADLPARHRGLRAAFDHSWALLGDRERRALRRLAVFRGGFSRQAASVVAGVTVPVLARLVDASLLSLDDHGRYWRHPFLLEYTEEKLSEDHAEEADVGARHGRYVLDLVASLFSDVTTGSRTRAAFDTLEREEADIVVAWDWALEAGAWDLLLHAIPTLAVYDEFRGRFHFGHDLAARIVARVEPDDPSSARLVCLAYAMRGYSLFRGGDPSSVLADAREAQALLPRFDLQARASLFAHWLAWHCSAVGAVVMGDVERNATFSRRALAVAEAALASAAPEAEREAPTFLAGVNRQLLVYAALQAGDLEAAERDIEASRVLFDSIDSHATTYAMHTHGQLLLAKGAYREAAEVLREALARVRETRKPTEAANILALLAEAEHGRGRLAEAEAVCDEAIRIANDVGEVWLTTSSLALKGRLAAARESRTEAATWFARSFAVAERHGLLGFGMAAVEGHAELLAERGRTDEAVRLLRFVTEYAHTPDWIRAAARARLEALDRPEARHLEITLDEVRAAMIPS